MSDQTNGFYVRGEYEFLVPDEELPDGATHQDAMDHVREQLVPSVGGRALRRDESEVGRLRAQVKGARETVELLAPLCHCDEESTEHGPRFLPEAPCPIHGAGDASGSGRGRGVDGAVPQRWTGRGAPPGPGSAAPRGHRRGIPGRAVVMAAELRVVTDIDVRLAQLLALDAAAQRLRKKRDEHRHLGYEQIKLGALDEVCDLVDPDPGDAS